MLLITLPEMPSPDPPRSTPVQVAPEPSDMEVEDDSMVPREAEFDRRFKRGPPTTAEELKTEIRSEHDDTANMAAYCLDFTCSDTGEMASVLMSLEGPPSWSFMTGPDFYDERTSSAKIFKQRVLPFGSVASVTAFLRVSLALWKIGSSLLHLMWSVYFDDFLCLARSSESRHVDFCVSTLFSLLGWKVSEHKLLDFNTICKVLGVQLDLRQSGSGICFVTNTAERVEELVAEIDGAMKSNLLPRRDGEKLRGRLQFASSQMFGRRFRRLLKVLSNHVTAGRQTLSDRTHDCLSEIRGLLLKNAPRKVESLQAEVVHIYVDASFDRDKYSGLGGMVVDMSKKTLFFFSETVDNDTLDEIMSKGQKTVIQELEMMAVLAAVKSWHSFLKSRKVVLFTDSESVRGSFLKTWSANDNSDDMINVIFEVEEGFDIPLWIERVPSQSNPSDVLSREVVAVFAGAERVRVNPREIWKSLVK